MPTTQQIIGLGMAAKQTWTTTLRPEPGVITDQMLVDAAPEGFDSLTVNDDGTVTLTHVKEEPLRTVTCDVCGGQWTGIHPSAEITAAHGYMKVQVGGDSAVHECPQLEVSE